VAIIRAGGRRRHERHETGQQWKDRREPAGPSMSLTKDHSVTSTGRAGET